MNLNVIIWIGVLVIFSGFVTFYVHSRNKKGKNKKSTNNNQGQTQKLINSVKRFCSNKGLKVIENVTIDDGKNKTVIDLVIVSRFGVIATRIKGYSGSVYASQNDKQWLHVTGENREYFDNLITVGKNDKNAIRKLFAKNDIFGIEIHQLAIFTSSKLELYVPKNLSVIKLNMLKKELKKPEFKREYNIDTSKITSLLQEHST